MPINFKAIADRLLADAPRYLAEWLPNGKRHGREYVVGGLQGESGESLSINIDSGLWKDFATGNGGGDLISLYAAIHNIKQGEAAKQFSSGKDDLPDDTYLPGPESPPIPPHTKYGKPEHVAEYRNADGKIVGYVCRFPPPGPNEKKQIMPRTCWRRHDGTIYWRWKKWPVASPIYRLPELLARPDVRVLIVEGEKKAEHAQMIMPDWVVVGWCGGVEAVKGTDWSPLKDRDDVWCWPDADAPGKKAAADIRHILPKLHIVKLPDGIAEGWDLGDAPIEMDVEAHMIEDLNFQQLQTISATDDFTLAQWLDHNNSEYAVIMRGSQVLVMRYWMAEDGQSRLVFLSQRDFLLWQEKNIVYIENDEGKVKPLKIGKAWLEWKGRQEFEEVYFEPCGPKYRRRYNLWQGFRCEPAAGASIELFLAHIKTNICQNNEEQYAWVMAWLADLFQKPNRKLGTALVLRGPMGIGKGVFANHIGYLLRNHFMPITQKGQLTGKFNGHMADKVLMFVDEGWWSDSSAGAGILRALITEPSVTIEMKGKDAVTLPNYTRFIVAANADWVVPVGMGDERRFVILDVGVAHQRDVPYFRAIDNQMRNGGYPALLHYLLNYQYDEALPRSVIKTQALTENKLHSMPDELKWFHECLINEKIGDFRLGNSLDNDIPCEKFYDSYVKWCQTMLVRPLPGNILPKMLRKADIHLVRKRRAIDTGNTRTTLYELPNLDTMRNYFSTHVGGAMDWEDI